MAKHRSIKALIELIDGDEADCFLLLAAKDALKTRDGKPYHRVTFRDATRELSFPIWENVQWSNACRDEWQAGAFYKLRVVFRETNFGPQLDILKIREATSDDAADGFDPRMCQPRSRFDLDAMWSELRGFAEGLHDTALRATVIKILDDRRETLLTLPAASRVHHTYVGGWLEHVLSVTRTCAYLAMKYTEYYPDFSPPLDGDLVIAGGILHDIGKSLELYEDTTGAEYTAAGHLIGHIVQGRDILRQAAAETGLEGERLLRLEHIVISHQRLAEWGSPKPPMTPEALLVHYADDCDAKFNMVYNVLRDASGDEPFTTSKNVLGQRIYRGPQ